MEISWQLQQLSVISHADYCVEPDPSEFIGFSFFSLYENQLTLKFMAARTTGDIANLVVPLLAALPEVLSFPLSYRYCPVLIVCAEPIFQDCLSNHTSVWKVVWRELKAF